MSELKTIGSKILKCVFIYILAFGSASILVLAETYYDFSMPFPYHNVKYHSMLSTDKPAVENSNDILSSENATDNQAAENRIFNVSVPEDVQYCIGEKTIPCDPTDHYRTMDGSCNNLIHPTWGIAYECYIRYQPAFYEGFETMQKSTNGDPLPTPRDITLNIFTDVHQPSSNISLMFTIYGQFLAHDVSRAENKNILVPCCSKEFSNHSSCIVIKIRSDDPFYSAFNVTCLNLHRTESCTICNTTNREQVNSVTSALDASMIYGSDDIRAMEIRTNDGTGKLVISSTEHGELLPIDTHKYEIFCRHQKPLSCFYAGDARVNMHVYLTGITTYLVREHNRIAIKLKEINPHWKEEKLYQEARRITTATLQCITYKEYLPQILSPHIMELYNLTVRNGTKGSKYNPNIRLGVSNEFATAGFRLHSMIPKEVGLEGFRFKDFFSKPEIVKAGQMERIMQGMYKAPSEKYDRYHVNDISDYMAQRAGVPYGIDLTSIDVMRARDHGLAPYTVMVRFCSGGQIEISTFDNLAPKLMSKHSAKILKEIYATVQDIELWVGMQLEEPFPGSEIGPTAGCLIAKQFYSLKFGDRFFYSHEGEVPSFTKDQRNSLEQCSLSRILCDNSDITQVQKNVMLLPSNTNPEVPCEEISEVDLSFWKENPPT